MHFDLRIWFSALASLFAIAVGCSTADDFVAPTGSTSSNTTGGGGEASGGSGSGASGGGGGLIGVPCDEGPITTACDCNEAPHATGYCCSGQWFDPYYEQLIGGCPAASAFRYVDPNHPSADDNGPGTEDQPWATIQHGVATTTGGQVLIVRAGTYYATCTTLRYEPALNPQSGSPGAPVILKADGEVIIEPAVVESGTAQGGSIDNIVLSPTAPSQDDAYRNHHVRIVGGTGAGQARMILRDFDQPGLPAYDGGTRTAWVGAHANGMGNWTTAPDATSQYEIVADGPLIGTLTRHDVVWDGFHVRERDNYHGDTGPVVIWDSQDVVILNSDLEGQVQLLLDNHNTVRLNNATRPVIRNNRIHGVGFPVDVGPNNPQNHAAIMMYFTYDAIIEHNEIYDSYTGIFPKGGDGSGHEIRYNVLHDCNKAFRFSYHLDVRVYQNAIYDCENAIQFAENLTNVAVFNNVVHGGVSGVNNWFPISGASAFNNIYLDNDYPNNFEGGVGTLMSEYNVYAGFTGFIPGDTLPGWQSLGFDAASMAGDPQFVDAVARDYHLQSGSPALTAGRDLGDLDNDQDTGETIPAGVYVAGDEVIGRLAEP